MKARKRNKDYWRDRMAALEDSQYQRSAAYYKDVQRQYARAANSIQMDISRWYQRLADNNGVSYAGAKKLLKKNELKEFKWTVEEYIKAGEENALNQRWMKELENASARHHISYLEAMKLQIQQHAELLSTEFEVGMTDCLRNAYGEQRRHTAFEIARGTGVGSNLGRLDVRRVDAAIRKPWAQDGANFSDRIWENKDKLVRNLHTELSQSIMRGASPQKAIESLSKTMEVSRSNAGRLIMTESAAIASAAQKECLKGLGVETYEILATLDSRTSDICQSLDGEVFEMKDYEVGVTAPPFHPWCRSTTVPFFDDEFTEWEQRAARGGDGKTQYVPADMKYEEWERRFINEPVRIPESLKITGSMTEEAKKVFESDISKIPKAHMDMIKSAINEIVVDPEGNSRYDRARGILYLSGQLDKGEVIHEMAHALETKLDVWGDPKFIDALKATIGDINPMWDAIRDEETFIKPITRLSKTDNLISAYQGRLYDDQIPLVDGDMRFNVYALGDFYSEAYKEYILRPDNLKMKQPQIYSYINGMVK